MSKQIKISEVLALLGKGQSREEIAESLDISMADCRRLFQHELLKGKKPKKQPAFTLVDDVSEGISQPETTSEEEIVGPGNEELETVEGENSTWDN